MTGGELAALVLVVAVTAAALVAIVWLAGQPSGPSRSERLLDKVLAPQPPMWTVSDPRCPARHYRYGRCERWLGHDSRISHVTDVGAAGSDDPGYSWSGDQSKRPTS